MNGRKTKRSMKKGRGEEIKGKKEKKEGEKL